MKDKEEQIKEFRKEYMKLYRLKKKFKGGDPLEEMKRVRKDFKDQVRILKKLKLEILPLIERLNSEWVKIRIEQERIERESIYLDEKLREIRVREKMFHDTRLSESDYLKLIIQEKQLLKEAGGNINKLMKQKEFDS